MLQRTVHFINGLIGSADRQRTVLFFYTYNSLLFWPPDDFKLLLWAPPIFDIMLNQRLCLSTRSSHDTTHEPRGGEIDRDRERESIIHTRQWWWWRWWGEEQEDKERSSTSLRTEPLLRLLLHTLHAGIRLYLLLHPPLLCLCVMARRHGGNSLHQFICPSSSYRVASSSSSSSLHSTRSTWLLQQQSSASASIITGWWCSINPIIPVHMVVRPFIPSSPRTYPFPPIWISLPLSLASHRSYLCPNQEITIIIHSHRRRRNKTLIWATCKTMMVKHSNERWFSHNSPKGNCFNINSVIIWEYSKVLIDPFGSSLGMGWSGWCRGKRLVSVVDCVLIS